MMMTSAPSSPQNDDKKLRRREQNRLSAQRSYHKKQERLQALRGQVSHLEAQYERQVTTLGPNASSSIVPSTPPMLEIPSGSADSSPASSPNGSHYSTDACELKTDKLSPSSPPTGTLQHLMASRAQLQTENDALRRRIDDHTKFQFRLQSLAAGEDPSESMALVHNAATGSPRFQPKIQMKRPLTVEECYTIGRNAYQHIRSYKFPEHHMSTGASACGWTDKRVLEDGLIKVEIKKVFQGRDAHVVGPAAWTAVKDPRKMDALYSLNMNMHSELTQRIDDNNIVMYQSYETPERDATGKETGAVCVMHHVMLMTSFQTETGYIIIFCSLDPDRLDESDHIVDLVEEEEAVSRGLIKRRRKQWFKKFSWLTFDQVGERGDDAECKYLFTVPSQHGASFYWPLEILLLILRFEIATVGPVILLPTSEEPMLESPSQAEASDPDEDEDIEFVIADHKLKIEPLAHDGRLGGVSAEDDMDELFIELFP